MPSLASAGVLGCFLLRCPTSGSHAFWQAAARRYELYPHGFRASIAEASSEAMCGIHDKKPLLSDL